MENSENEKGSAEKISEIKAAIEEWASKQNHERCWYYPDIFKKVAEISGVKLPLNHRLPSLEEFKCGCERYQEEEFQIENNKDRITEEKLQHYKDLTSTALAEVKKAVIGGKESEAEEIIKMVENYLSDSAHFQAQGNFVDAFAALNYAHGWLDAGVRLSIFNVTNDKLFTVK